jgi:hypothetical protein
MQLTTGPLKVRVTNLATGESRTLHISGLGRALIDEDRGTFTQEGPWLTLVILVPSRRTRNSRGCS